VSSTTPDPRTIGRYRILDILGEGGMGIVYLAEQDHPHRQVALKVIRADHASSTIARRFERESEVLGRLQHPGIAQIYEAGTEVRGDTVIPYFAMELVVGLPITEYVHAHCPTTRERLDPFAKVCDAVAALAIWHAAHIAVMELSEQDALGGGVAQGRPDRRSANGVGRRAGGAADHVRRYG
jgi:serine/threonine protein kinase